MKIINGIYREQVPVTVKDETGKAIINNEYIDPWKYLERNASVYTVAIGDGSGKTWGPFNDPEGVVIVAEYTVDKEGHQKEYVVLCSEQES